MGFLPQWAETGSWLVLSPSQKGFASLFCVNSVPEFLTNSGSLGASISCDLVNNFKESFFPFPGDFFSLFQPTSVCHCNHHLFDKDRLEENTSWVSTSEKTFFSSLGLAQAPCSPQAGFAFLDFFGGDEPVIAVPDSQRPRGFAAKA